MNKVLVVKLEAPTYSSSGIVRAFKEHFVEVSEFDWQKVKFNEGPIGMWERLLAKVEMEKPDLIWLHVQTQGVLDSDIVRDLSSSAFTVLYTFDKRTDLGWIKDLAPHLGLVLLPDTDSVIEMKREGFANVEHCHSSCDSSLYHPYPANLNKWSTNDADRDSSIPEIVFIGNNYENTSLNFDQSKQRVEMVEFMKGSFGKNFGVFGQGWKKTRPVNTQEEINLLNGCKIAITQNNFNAGRYTSDRLWRSLSCRAFTVSQYYYGINQDFKPGTMKVWIDFEMLKQECEKYLKLDKERDIIAGAGRGWFLSNHTWSHRVEQMIKLIEKHKIGKNELGQSAATN